MRCPSYETLYEYPKGIYPTVLRKKIEKHLAECEACKKKLTYFAWLKTPEGIKYAEELLHKHRDTILEVLETIADCLDDEAIAAMADGGTLLGDKILKHYHEHLAGCFHCRRELANFMSNMSELRE